MLIDLMKSCIIIACRHAFVCNQFFRLQNCLDLFLTSLLLTNSKDMGIFKRGAFKVLDPLFITFYLFCVEQNLFGHFNLNNVKNVEFECLKFFIAKKIEAKSSKGLSHFFKGFERFFSPIRDVYIKVKKNQHFRI
jgi:hypothetical protein